LRNGSGAEMNKFLARAISGMIPFRKLRHQVRKKLMNTENGRAGENKLGILELLVRQSQDTLEQLIGQSKENDNKTLSRLEALCGEISAIRNEMILCREEVNKAKEYAKASVYNQIALANRRHIPCVLHLPGGTQTFLKLRTTKNGFLHYPHPDYGNFDWPETMRGPRILLTSIPKSGTMFMVSVLEELGFRHMSDNNVEGTFYDAVEMLNDYQNRSRQKQHLYAVKMPLLTQLSLILPGTMLVGHFKEESLAAAFRYVDGPIAMIRDLRHVFVSFMRMLHACNLLEEQIEEGKTVEHWRANIDSKKLLPNDLIVQINSPTGRWILDIASRLARMMDKYHCFVRFEDLMSNNDEKLRLALDIVVRATGKPEEDVYLAFSRVKNLRTQLRSYTGRHSTLDGIWTPEVEEAFISADGDAINEALGYAKLYPSSLS
jgi:hypothetical protein